MQASPHTPLARLRDSGQVALGLVSLRAAFPLLAMIVGRSTPDPMVHKALFGLQGLLSLAAFIAFVVWSYRALSTFRDAGVEAMSPGLGAGGWFIPLANLVLPWLAARSTLRAAGHRSPLAGLWWLAWLIHMPLGFQQQQSVLFYVGLSDQPPPLEQVLYDLDPETALSVMQSVHWGTMLTEVASWGLLAAIITVTRRAGQ